MTEENLEKLTINYLTDEQYNKAKENGELNENELYCTPENDNADTNVIYDLTLQSDSNHVSIPCDILRDGGNYELLCIGRLVSGINDIYLRLNNDNSNVYYQSGFGYNFSGKTDDTTGSAWSGYRPNKDGFYVCASWFSEDYARCMIKYNISLLKKSDFPIITLQNGRTYNSNSLFGLASCQTSKTFENITSIDLLPANGNNSFAAGTRFILKKI